MDKLTNQQLHAKAVEAYLGKDVYAAVAAHVERIKRVRKASKNVLRVSK